MYVVIFGAPGAGKGTQAALISQELKLVHIASGDIFREEVSKGSELGLVAKSYMNKGVLVPDDITIKMIMGWLSVLGQQQGFILDGFPRTLEQAQALDQALGEKGKAIDRAVYIQVPQEELIRRLSGRLSCRVCQSPYHLVNAPPKVPGKCDRCGGELYQRPDDTEGTVRKRLEVYLAQTAPLIEYYRKKGKLVEINGGQGVAEVTGELLSKLRPRAKSPPKRAKR